MTPSMWWSNLVAYSAQILALVAVGALLPALFGLRVPAARLAWWQLLLAACLAVPALQSWERSVVTVTLTTTIASPAIGTLPPAPLWSRLALGEIGLAVLAAGAAARDLWLALGFWRLRRYRRGARPLDAFPAVVRAALASTGVTPRVCLSAEVAGPVTFGLFEPAVLLPARFPELPEHAQEAILCHEFLHVRRRDWLASVAEELVAIVLWFHPAVWWLLGQIRLAREQAVDREVVELTRRREQYVDALLAMAGARLEPDLAPAPVFLRKRHLVERVASLLKEATMSKRRVVVSLASFAAVLAGTGWFAARSFPLSAAPQVKAAAQPDAPGVTVDAGAGRLLHRGPVSYPREALEKRIQGTVVLELTLNREGAVADARVLSGPEELRRAALESALQWHYSREGTPAERIEARIDFRLPEPVATPAVQLPNRGVVARRVPPPPLTQGTLKRIDLDSLPEPLSADLRSRLGRFEGQPMSSQLLEEIKKAAHEVDRHLNFAFRIHAGEETSLVVVLGEAPRSTVASATSDADFPPSGEQRIRVGGAVQSNNAIEKTAPVYPPLAKQARISGVVRLNALIGTDGRVKQLTLISGHPLLVPPALESVKEWVYKPTLLNGKPVEVITQIDVNFTLAE